MADRTKKKLRSLSRAELLEILIEQSRQIEQLESTLGELEVRLEEKKKRIRESGSTAEAVMKLHDVFESAEKAAEQYLENIKRMEKEKEKGHE